jgi:hypothetical protein
LGALGRRFESCRPDFYDTKGFRGFIGVGLSPLNARLCADCVQKPLLPCCARVLGSRRQGKGSAICHPVISALCLSLLL